MGLKCAIMEFLGEAPSILFIVQMALDGEHDRDAGVGDQQCQLPGTQGQKDGAGNLWRVRDGAVDIVRVQSLIDAMLQLVIDRVAHQTRKCRPAPYREMRPYVPMTWSSGHPAQLPPSCNFLAGPAFAQGLSCGMREPVLCGPTHVLVRPLISRTMDWITNSQSRQCGGRSSLRLGYRTCSCPNKNGARRRRFAKQVISGFIWPWPCGAVASRRCRPVRSRSEPGYRAREQEQSRPDC